MEGIIQTQAAKLAASHTPAQLNEALTRLAGIDKADRDVEQLARIIVTARFIQGSR